MTELKNKNKRQKIQIEISARLYSEQNICGIFLH